MTTIDRSPARVSSGMSILGGIVGFLTSGFFSWIALTIGSIGLVLLVIGVVRGTHRVVTYGGFGLLTATIAAGIQGAPILPLVGSLTATVLAWDIGHSAITIGDQLGRAATTTRIEAVHIASSTVVGLGTITVGYGLFRVGRANQPLATLIFLLIGAVLLIAVLE